MTWNFYFLQPTKVETEKKKEEFFSSTIMAENMCTTLVHFVTHIFGKHA